MTSILSTLGVGSGIDTKALIDALVSAEQTPRETALKAQSDTIDAKISGLAQVKSGLDALVTALASRTTGGALGPLPASSDSTILSASSISGSTPDLQPTSIDVTALATGETLVSGALSDGTATVGTGVLTLRLGTMTDDGAGGFSFASGTGDPIDITITDANNSLTGLRDAINAAQPAGANKVVASIINDGTGARLVLKGGTGAANAFTLTAAPDGDDTGGDTGLARFVHMPGTSTMTRAATAADAQLTIDGVSISRPSNTIADLVTGSTITLNKVGSATVGVSRDPAGLKTAISDVVSAVNALQGLAASLSKVADAQDPAGALLGDASIRSLHSKLLALISTPIGTGTNGAPTRLAELGISTARDGTLSIDDTKITAAIAANPDAVEAMLVSLTSNGVGTAPMGALTAIQTDFATATGSDTGETARLTTQKARITTDEATLTTRMDAMRTQLTQQYAAMETAVAAFKATQDFMTEQIKAWNQTTN
jgi:flagellar hook-associated protein 2